MKKIKQMTTTEKNIVGYGNTRKVCNLIENQVFESYSVETFNLVTDTNLQKDMTFTEAIDEIEKEEVSYFYLSMCKEDVLEAIKNEREIANQLDLRLIYIEDLSIYIATY